MYYQKKQELRGYSTPFVFARYIRFDVLQYLIDVKGRNDLSADQQDRIKLVETVSIDSPDEMVRLQRNKPPRHRHYVYISECQVRDLTQAGVDITRYLGTPAIPRLLLDNRSEYLISAQRYPVVAEALSRSLGASSFVDQFRFYFDQTAMKEYLARQDLPIFELRLPSYIPKREGFAPLWLRRRLFVDSQLLMAENIKCLQKISVKKLPSSLLDTDMSQQQLRENHLRYELRCHFSSLGISEIFIDTYIINDIIASKHLADTVYKLTSVGDIYYQFSDFADALKSVKPILLEQFFKSSVWDELQKKEVKNVMFIVWCANNIKTLEKVLSENRDFFLATLIRLLELRSVDREVDIHLRKPLRDDKTGGRIWLTSLVKTRSFVCLVDIILLAFKRPKIVIPPDALCEIFFNPSSNLLERVVQRDYLEVFAAVPEGLRHVKMSDGKIIRHFVSYYECSNPCEDFFLAEHQVLVQLLKLKEKDLKSCYKNKTWGEWLCSKTHERVLRKFLFYSGRQGSFVKDISFSVDHYSLRTYYVMTSEQSNACSLTSLNDEAGDLLKIWAKKEMLDNPEACENDLDERLKRLNDDSEKPRVLSLLFNSDFLSALSIILNQSKGLRAYSCDHFFQKYENVMILLFINAGPSMSADFFLDILRVLINNESFSNPEYLVLLIREFGTHVLARLGSVQVEQCTAPLTLLQFLMSAESLEKLRVALTAIRYQSLKEVMLPDQYISQNIHSLASMLDCKFLLDDYGAIEVAQKKSKVDYDGYYNSTGFFSDATFPDVEFGLLDKTPDFPVLMDEIDEVISFDPWFA